MSLSRRLANLGKAIDSATTGHFLSKGDSDGLFETIQYTDLTGRPTVLDSANVTAIVDSAYVQLRQTTAGGSGGLDSAAITNLVDSAYVSARSPAAASGFAAYEYNTSAAQTTFQDSDVNGNVLSYSANGIIVYYNGVLMPTSDYTATDGSSVVFTTAVDSGGTVTIAKWALASSGGSGGSSISWGGSRGFRYGGNSTNIIDYWDITTPGNATDFGDTLGSFHRDGGQVGNGTRIVSTNGFSNASGSLLSGDIGMQYITCSTPGNGTDFGDLLAGKYQNRGVSNGSRGVFAGGRLETDNSHINVMEYITIDTTGNSTDFGDMATLTNYDNRARMAAVSNSTRGVFAGGSNDGYSSTNDIQYITIATTGNATEFGDLLTIMSQFAGAADATRGVIMGGSQETGGANNFSNQIQYITVDTTGNSADFGDMTYPAQGNSACSDNTYACAYGGYDYDDNYAVTNNICRITIQTLGNATDFGDLTDSNNLHSQGASGNAS